MENTRAGWVLVGGRSSRMGFDKALLDTGSGPLALEVAGIVAQTCGPVTFVGDPARYAHLGLPVIPDSHPGHGPLGGIETALAASQAQWNLIVACDMPALEPAVFETLFQQASGFDCALPQHPDGRVEPLCAVYNKRCHPAIAAALTAGTRKVTDALQALAVRYVQMDRSEPFANWNTPSDIRTLPNG